MHAIEKEFADREMELTSPELSNKERKRRVTAVGKSALEEAYGEFNACELERADKIVEEMEEAVTQNPGACIHAMFKILQRACGAKQTDGAKLMSLYGEDGEVVRGGEVRDEVARQAVKINARREVDTPAVRTLLEWIQEYPKEGRGHRAQRRTCARGSHSRRRLPRPKRAKDWG